MSPEDRSQLENQKKILLLEIDDLKQDLKIKMLQLTNIDMKLETEFKKKKKQEKLF
jgi:hypothetical protein